MSRRTSRKPDASRATAPTVPPPSGRTARDREANERGLPSLRGALWLYLASLLGTAAIIIGLQGGIRDLYLLRLLAAVFAGAGFTLIAAQITGTRLSQVMGRAPRLRQIIECLLIGALAWLPASWLIFITNALLNTAIGTLPPPPALTRGALPLIVAFQLGVIAPICYGLLFWAYLQRAAEGLGRDIGALVAALLYGLFGLVSTEFGYSAIPGILLVGGFAAAAVYLTGSAWAGIAVTSGYSLIRPLIEGTEAETQLFSTLGLGSGEALLSSRWLLVIAVCLFGAFLLIQSLRAARDAEALAAIPRATPRRFWQLPLIAALGICLLIGYGEIAARSENPPAVPPPADGSTIVPPTPGP